MKKSIHIVYLLVYLISFQLQAQGQSSLLSCGGSRVRYGVSGLPNSIYQWSITGGTIDKNYNDSIDVSWDPANKNGTLSVTEHSAFGCVASPYSTNITINNPTLSLGSQISVCQGKTTDIVAPSAFSSYQWSNGATNSTITVSNQGWYKLKATNDKGCSTVDSIYLSLLPAPIVHLGNDTILCEGTLTLDAGADGQSYKWSTGEITRTIQLSYDKEGHVMSVEVENDLGCITKDTIEIISCNIVTNTITPNGDGWNDKWKVDRFVSSKISVEIFDRWGRMVYQSSNGLTTDGWDGTSRGRALPMDSYYYIVKHNDSGKVEKGTITIIR